MTTKTTMKTTINPSALSSVLYMQLTVEEVRRMALDAQYYPHNLLVDADELQLTDYVRVAVLTGVKTLAQHEVNG